MSDNHKKISKQDVTRSYKSGMVTPRQYRFPPLRKPWMVADTPPSVALEPADYQKQLIEGFQEGVSKGFEQGLIQGKEEGYQDGVRLGYQEGMQKGSQVGKELFTEAAQPLEKIATQLQTFLADYAQRRRAELLQLVEKVTHQVIRCELALQPTQLLSLVEEALLSLPSVPAQLKVFLNLEEFERIRDAEPGKVQEWGLTADPAMEPGECRVVTEVMEMDVGCQHRLQQCMDVLKENLLPEQVE